jgi:hypothetical protein
MTGALNSLGRAIASRDMAPDLAAHVLSLEFPPDVVDRYQELSEKARLGTLSKEEGDELDGYLYADSILSMFKAKARASLVQRNPAA